MLPDQARRIVIADRDRRRALEALIDVQEVKAGIAALIDAEAFHDATDASR